MMEKENKILISHASSDKEYMELLVKLLETLRFPNGTIICSSVPGYGIPGGKKIYEWLKEQFLTCNLHVIFALSDNYYDSPACLNEMGATWVTKSSSTLFLLPGFEFSSVKGCVDATEVGISIDSSDDELKHRLNELKRDLTDEYSLEPIEDIRWEQARDKFIYEMRAVGKKKSKENKVREYSNAESIAIMRERKEPRSISVESAFLLVYAASGRGEITMLTTLTGTLISTAGVNFIRSDSPRETAKWKEALHNLVEWGWVVPVGSKGEIYEVTGTGFDRADLLKEELQIDVEQDPIEQIKEYNY